MNNDNQVVEATNSTEEVVIEETNEVEETAQETETVVEEKQEKTYSEQEFKAVLARAKKAEAALKTKPKETINNQLPEELIEEKILKSQGISVELLDEAKALAKVRGKSLLDIQNDPIFVALRESKEAEAKAQKAKLGASKGSASIKKEKGFDSRGLSDAEHKELWKKSMGR